MIDERALSQIAPIFKAMGEVSRLAILRQLMSETELSVGQLSDRCNLSNANASKHLKHLHQAGLVNSRREGNTIFYRITEPMVRQICEICCQRMEEKENEALKNLMARVSGGNS